MKNKPVKSGLAKARATSKHSRLAPLLHQDPKIPKKKVSSFEDDLPWDEDKVSKPKGKPKDIDGVMDSVKKSRKELSRVFEDLTGQSTDEFDEDVSERQAALKARFKEISENIKQGDMLNPELVIKDLYITILTTTIDLLPLAEKAYRASKKESAAYAYTNLADKVQQLAADIRVLKDTSGQAAFLVDQIIQPLFLSLTTIIIQESMNIKAEIDSVLGAQPKRAAKLKKITDVSARKYADFMNKATIEIREKTEAFLSGALSPTPTTSKQKRTK